MQITAAVEKVAHQDASSSPPRLHASSFILPKSEKERHSSLFTTSESKKLMKIFLQINQPP